MKKLTVKDRIYEVLMENQNGFLTPEQIAEISYGPAYIRDTRKGLDSLIKRNMIYAIGQLNKDGYVVIKDLEPTENGIKLSYKKVLGYKIADTEDIDDVKKNLKTKEERLEIYQEKKKEFKELAEDNQLLLK